jgi:hypothetical protein
MAQGGGDVTQAMDLAATCPVQLQEIVHELDPFTCIPKRNQKYAFECTEVYLADQDAEELSENFCKFPNLEVVWFNTNRLTRLGNLESNFRIREVFVQDNRLVSLAGLKNCHFLRVLLAGNNQIRNLEKQLTFLKRFLFLKKLELSGNPVADEPEYRLQLIFHAPQVEIFDNAVVKDPERTKAAEVVPNLDKVTGPPPKSQPPKSARSKIEQDIYRERRQILERRCKKEEEAMAQMFTTTSSMRKPLDNMQHKQFVRNKQAWSTPRDNKCLAAGLILREQPRPTPWEVPEMLKTVEMVAGKQELTRADVTALCDRLSKEGLEDMGRSLTKPNVFSFLPDKIPGKQSMAGAAVRAQKVAQLPDGFQHPLEALSDPKATMPTSDVAKFLLTLDWQRQDEGTINKRIDKLYADAKHADIAGNKNDQSLCQMAALRLEGAKDRMLDSKLVATGELLNSARRPRADVFYQTFLRPETKRDEETGRKFLQVSVKDRQAISLGG